MRAAREQRGLDAADIARKVVEVASDKQAQDIVMLDLRGVATFTDYFVICSGTSARQIRTLVEEIEKALRQDGIRPLHLEGTDDTGWVLMDFGDVIVHIFHPREREFYGLERLWRTATPVLRIQ